MREAEIKNWIAYWTAANAVAFHEIHSEDDVSEARRWCPVMRDGVFANVTDGEIWRALSSIRQASLAA